MSYQVLARKWRPKNFQELMGQEHVVTVLANALSQQRLHHAYLFTGTRGVGKTTIARIFAKSLNCDIGVTDKPCGKCDACVDIDQGRFIDLLEIDAASKTKVDDTREILDNVQYAPTRGRYKVYLIDEVHMLSRHSFNALLKTLEEPPEHVKFILATTDPQKLPITVLSRCLQFHLKALNVAQIETKLTEILKYEEVAHEAGSLTLLAKAARGSMRDSLSLTDQAIAQGQGNITLANIQQMLGDIDQNWIFNIVIHLLKQDSQGLMALSQEIAAYAPSYNRLFAELIQLFHQIALMQVVEKSFTLSIEQHSLLKKFSQAMSAEDVQLYYQICVNGRKDLPYAADEQAAFDMTLLRLLAFKPMQRNELKNNVIQDAVSDNSANSEAHFNEAMLSSTTLSETQANEFDNENLNSGVINDATPQNYTAITDAKTNDELAARNITNNVSELGKDTSENINEDKHEAAQTLAAEMLAIETQAQQQQNESNTTSHAPRAPLQDTALPFDDSVAGATTEVPSASDSLSNSTSYKSTVGERQSEDNSEFHQPQLDNESVELPASATSEAITPQNVIPAISDTLADSPISSVLATRNMLRSRKKQLESQEKKSDGAKERQITDPKQSNATESNSAENSATKPSVAIPEPEAPYQPESIDPAVVRKANQVDKWAHMIDSMQLTARIRQLAIHATISDESTDDSLILLLDQATSHLNTEVAQQQLQSSISEFLSRPITVTLTIVESTVADPFQIQSHINDKRYDYAKALLKEDPVVIALQDNFQATLDEETINAH
ncbi:DNA polymerase III subunit gamma/tau [Colwellia sp. D2M02]|uniref:DNA polymerase III subunit gamma/tau n=1 Tax=Colwellia sp. D2M02 TaxID=2841562 RepID=UPI001C084FE5|nr:DNA polymerase III subunit gamma/tau [Colwellia sp. D2M02]MBU2894035.1 DNA polymerase III subunit gamma/tau [Colwellia sp. D2M02]